MGNFPSLRHLSGVAALALAASCRYFRDPFCLFALGTRALFCPGLLEFFRGFFQGLLNSKLEQPT